MDGPPARVLATKDLKRQSVELEPYNTRPGGEGGTFPGSVMCWIGARPTQARFEGFFGISPCVWTATIHQQSHVGVSFQACSHEAAKSSTFL